MALLSSVMTDIFQCFKHFLTLLIKFHHSRWRGPQSMCFRPLLYTAFLAYLLCCYTVKPKFYVLLVHGINYSEFVLHSSSSAILIVLHISLHRVPILKVIIKDNKFELLFKENLHGVCAISSIRIKFIWSQPL